MPLEDFELLNAHPLPYRIYPGNRIVVTVGPKKTVLRWTVDQHRRYAALMQTQTGRNVAEDAKVADVIEQVRINHLDVLDVALNPDPNKIEFTREEIAAGLDANHIGHLAQIWSQELINPGLHARDPIRAPVAG